MKTTTKKTAKKTTAIVAPIVAPIVALPIGKRAYGKVNVIPTTFKHDGEDLALLMSSGKFRNQAEAIKWALRFAAHSL